MMNLLKQLLENIRELSRIDFPYTIQLNRSDEKRKSHIVQISGNPYYLRCFIGHHGLFRPEYSNYRNAVPGGFVQEPVYIIR